MSDFDANPIINRSGSIPGASQGLLAVRPVAGAAPGDWYLATDAHVLYRWTGSAWVPQLAPGAGEDLEQTLLLGNIADQNIILKDNLVTPAFISSWTAAVAQLRLTQLAAGRVDLTPNAEVFTDAVGRQGYQDALVATFIIPGSLSATYGAGSIDFVNLATGDDAKVDATHGVWVNAGGDIAYVDGTGFNSFGAGGGIFAVDSSSFPFTVMTIGGAAGNASIFADLFTAARTQHLPDDDGTYQLQHTGNYSAVAGVAQSVFLIPHSLPYTPSGASLTQTSQAVANNNTWWRSNIDGTNITVTFSIPFGGGQTVSFFWQAFK